MTHPPDVSGRRSELASVSFFGSFVIDTSPVRRLISVVGLNFGCGVKGPIPPRFHPDEMA